MCCLLWHTGQTDITCTCTALTPELALHHGSKGSHWLSLDIFIPHRDHKPRLSSRHNVFHSSFSVFLNLFFCFEEQDFDSDDPSESASSLPIGVSASLLPISASNAFSFSKLLVSFNYCIYPFFFSCFCICPLTCFCAFYPYSYHHFQTQPF